MNVTALTSHSQGRGVAIAILVAAVVLVAAALLGPLVWLYLHYDGKLAEYSDQLSRFERVASSRPAVEARLAGVKAREPRAAYLKGGSPALAASEVQDRVKTLVESAGGRINSLQILPHKDDGRYRQVAVNVQISVNLPALRRILHSIEGGRPYLMVDNLTVRSFQNMNSRPVPGLEPDLFVQMEVSGMALVEVK